MKKSRVSSRRRPPRAEVAVDAGAPGAPLDMTRFGLGQGGLSDEPMWEEHVAAVRALHPSLIRLFVQEYFNVYPDHGVYRWDALDRSVETILKAGAKPLLSICIKPKALYPAVDPTRVHPSSYEEWEDLIRRMVRHFNVEKKCGIEYWEVFNEPNAGETGGCPSLFTAEDYCTYYEHTARAIVEADPRAKVGGPALLGFDAAYVRTFLDGCVARKLPVHFVSWHTYQNDVEVVRQRMAESRELLGKYPALRCENILDEWNMSLAWDRTEPAFQPCYIVETTYHMIEEGIDRACYYHIRDWHLSKEQFEGFMSKEGTRAMVNFWNRGPMFCGLFDFQGVVRPSYFAFKMLGRLTGRRLEARSTRPAVKFLASRDEELGAVNVLAWNFALEPPPACRADVRVGRLGRGKWLLRRFLLDARTPSSLESDRMRLVRTRTLEDADEARESFELPPYGVTLLTLQRQ